MSASSRSGALADRNFKLPVLGCKDNALTRFQVNRIEEVFPTDFAVNPPRFINRTLGIKDHAVRQRDLWCHGLHRDLYEGQRRTHRPDPWGARSRTGR